MCACVLAGLEESLETTHSNARLCAGGERGRGSDAGGGGSLRLGSSCPGHVRLDTAPLLDEEEEEEVRGGPGGGGGLIQSTTNLKFGSSEQKKNFEFCINICSFFLFCLSTIGHTPCPLPPFLWSSRFCFIVLVHIVQIIVLHESVF